MDYLLLLPLVFQGPVPWYPLLHLAQLVLHPSVQVEQPGPQGPPLLRVLEVQGGRHDPQRLEQAGLDTSQRAGYDRKVRCSSANKYVFPLSYTRIINDEVLCTTYIKDCIVPFSFLNFWILDPSRQVVDHHEFQERGVDEAHADGVPEVHGREVGDYREVGAEPIRGGEEIQHGGHTEHHTGRHGVPFYPEGDEGGGDEDDAWGSGER